MDDREREGDAEEGGGDCEVKEEEVERVLFVLDLEIPSSFARFEGEDSSFAFPFPLSIPLILESSSIGSSTRLPPCSIPPKLIADPVSSVVNPFVVLIELVELSALCLAFLPTAKVLVLLELRILIRSESSPPPSISIIFLVNNACAEFDDVELEDVAEPVAERLRVLEEEEEAEGPTKSWSSGLLEDEVTGGAGREGGALQDIEGLGSGGGPAEREDSGGTRWRGIETGVSLVSVL